MNCISKIGLSALLTLYSLAGLAQSTEEDELLLSYGDEELISIATGKAQPIFKAPAVATVITAHQIEAMGASHLNQVLESIPGLHISFSSTRGSPVYTIRGIHTDKNPQILVLVNGVPLTQLLVGDRGLRSTLPINQIARIEVIRGPGSAIYGADAFSGVINVITKNANQVNGLETGTRIGSFNTQDLWVLYGNTINEWDVYVGVEASESDGDDGRIIEVDAQSAFDAVTFPAPPVSLAPGPLDTAYERLDVNLEVSNESWTFRGWYWHQHDGVFAGLASALDPDGNSRVSNYLVDVKYKGSNTAKTWEYESHLSYMDINSKSEQTLFPKGTLLPISNDGNIALPNQPATPVIFSDGLVGNPEAYENHTRLDLTGYYSGFSDHLVRVAAGFSYARLEGKESKNFGPGILDNPGSLPGSPFPVVDGTLTDVSDTEFVYIKSKDRKVHYLSLQDEWSLAGDWALTVGVRYDHYSDFGSTVNPRIALVWDAQQNLTTKFLYGKAFRAPSMLELFAINNPVVLGNPKLDPEVIDTYELALDYRPSLNLRTGLNIFHYKLNDFIEFVPDQGLGSRTAQNVGTRSGNGFELEFDWSIEENIKLSGHYAYQKSEDEKNNVDSANAPEQQIYVSLNWNMFSNWFFNTQAYWIADRNREFGDMRPPIDDYTMMDINVGCRCITAGLEVSLAVKNLFDKDAFEPSSGEVRLLIPGDYPLEGRSAFLRARYRF